MLWKRVVVLVLAVPAEFGVWVFGAMASGYVVVLLISLFLPVADTFQWWPLPLLLVAFSGCFLLRRAVRCWAERLGRELSDS